MNKQRIFRGIGGTFTIKRSCDCEQSEKCPRRNEYEVESVFKEKGKNIVIDGKEYVFVVVDGRDEAVKLAQQSALLSPQSKLF